MIKFDIKVKRHVYGEQSKSEVTFIIDDFNDMISLFKIENSINMVNFLKKFKTYNPSIGEGDVNGKIHI